VIHAVIHVKVFFFSSSSAVGQWKAYHILFLFRLILHVDFWGLPSLCREMLALMYLSLNACQIERQEGHPACKKEWGVVEVGTG